MVMITITIINVFSRSCKHQWSAWTRTIAKPSSHLRRATTIRLQLATATEAQLSQRDRATLCVIEYFAKSFKVTRGHSKWHPWVGRVQVPINILLKLRLYLVAFLRYSALNNGNNPTILSPPTTLCFDDKYAFRSTAGSTTAALIAILHSVTDRLSTNPFVVVLALDLSKAFDTVRHASLFCKMALLNVPDPVYNWLVDFFSDHEHCTSFGDSVSAYQPISASIIQGSAIGPVSFVVNASDLSTVTPGNRMHKYADDTYIRYSCLQRSDQGSWTRPCRALGSRK